MPSLEIDPGIDEMFSAQNSDYWKSGWSRGHMAPAGDNKFLQVSSKFLAQGNNAHLGWNSNSGLTDTH